MKELRLFGTFTAHIVGWAVLFAVPMLLLVYVFIVPIGGTMGTILSGITGIIFGCAAVVLGNITFYRWLSRQPYV